ncbi:MAG: DNA alkylation repair protein [Cytophagia bacterium]|nr:DNA alkylation repair protein [Cytophagia bacterium]
MEPLKEMFNTAYYTRLAHQIKLVHRPFASEKFLKHVVEPLDALSLNERMRHTSVVLHQHLPTDYKKSISILKETIPLLQTGYTNLVFPDFVSQFGMHDVKTSLQALHYFTQFGSAEFAIRTFLKADIDNTLKVMYQWSEDDNEHVRRLSSEGSRPRLPWSFKLDAIIQNPSLTKPILENLKQDDSLYVRKSVANHINDVSKDKPDYVLRLVKTWDKQHPHTAWIVKRGCRSLFKQGDQQSLAAFNFTKDVKISLRKFKLSADSVKIGEAITFQFELLSKHSKTQKLMVDYRVHYVKKGGGTSPKVFKLKEINLEPNAGMLISKKQSFKDFTTRKHYPGKHALEILVNGEVVKRVIFVVKHKE